MWADIARAWSHGELPLLSPFSWVCSNLAGEFQYGVFSVFVSPLIVVVSKFPLVFHQQAAVLSIVHLAVAAAGAYLLAHDRNLSAPFATIVALIAALNGWIICWGATDWFGALAAFAWLPWCWWAAERALDPRQSAWRFLWPAPFVYLLITGGFPYTVLMLAVVLVWAALRALFQLQAVELTPPKKATTGAGDWVSRSYLFLTTSGPLLLGVLLGVGMSAPAWLAISDYVQGSARQLQSPSAHFQWIVPWRALPGFILPAWTVNWANFSTRYVPHSATELACGTAAPAILIAGVLWHARIVVSRLKWELMLLLFVLVLAMLPTAGVFRWSFRWLPLAHLVLAVCAAETLKLLTEKTHSADAAKRFVPILRRPSSIAVLLVVLCIIAAKLLGSGGEYLFPLSWLVLGLVLIWACIDHTRSSVLVQWAPAGVTFAVLLATYNCIPPNCGVPKYNFAQSLLRPEPLDPERLYLSVYPPPEQAYRVEIKPHPVGQIVRPGSTSMWGGLRFVNGYSPIRPAGVAREFATAIHGEIDPNMAAWLVWSEAHRDGLLARLGVDGIIIAREYDFAPLPASEWQLVIANEEGRVFHRRGGPLPRVRSIEWFSSNASPARVTSIAEARNSVSAWIDVAEGEDAGMIAFSRPFFRGYVARLNGRPLEGVTTVRSLIPIISVPAGAHGRLELIYRPTWLVYGGAVAIICAAIWITLALFGFAGSRRQRSVGTVRVL